MPRVNGIMQTIPGAYGSPGSTIESAKYNSQLDDLVADANAARPIGAGGTGATNPEAARIALGLGDPVQKAGDRMIGSLSSAIKAHGLLGSVTEEFKYADGNTHSVTVAGAFIINPTGLSEGDVMQVNALFNSGSIAVSGTTYWELGGGLKSTTIADLEITLVAGTPYRLVFELVAGLRTGVFQ